MVSWREEKKGWSGPGRVWEEAHLARARAQAFRGQLDLFACPRAGHVGRAAPAARAALDLHDRDALRVRHEASAVVAVAAEEGRGARGERGAQRQRPDGQRRRALGRRRSGGVVAERERVEGLLRHRTRVAGGGAGTHLAAAAQTLMAERRAVWSKAKAAGLRSDLATARDRRSPRCTK